MALGRIVRMTTNGIPKSQHCVQDAADPQSSRVPPAFASCKDGTAVLSSCLYTAVNEEGVRGVSNQLSQSESNTVGVETVQAKSSVSRLVPIASRT